jgi:hypothetical protein
MSDDKHCVVCLECGRKTEDFYLVPSNRGKTHKCKNCYELSFVRGLRNDYIYDKIRHISKSS